jgi:beta-glucosidase
MSGYRFPEGFVWGAATSAQQIEGAVAEDGRSESIWDRFCKAPGNISDGSDASVACDHYHRWREDIGLMRDLGIGAYRFSVAWPRIVPGGTGPVNEAGLDFYDALVDELLESGIRPFVTLYHWDLPQVLQDSGGWSSRGIVDAFVRYAEAVCGRLGDRVSDWITHNEPWCIAVLGHEEGEHAPGHRDPAETLRVAHHVLLSHGKATETIRALVPGARVGIVLNLVTVEAASGAEADGEAARRFDGAFNRWFLDPVFRGRYPDDAVADRLRLGHLDGPRLPFVGEGDLGTISTPLDFFGLNYYSRFVVRAGEDGEPEEVPPVPEKGITEMGWEIHPEGLFGTLARLRDEYAPKEIYITENGAAFPDTVGPDGRIRDWRRIEYLRDHLTAAGRAIAAGVPLKGYFVWSLLDNFEWAHGYTKRFGIHRVDYDSQRRLAKDSAFWYRDAVAANAVPGEEWEFRPRRSR